MMRAVQRAVYWDDKRVGAGDVTRMGMMGGAFRI